MVSTRGAVGIWESRHLHTTRWPRPRLFTCFFFLIGILLICKRLCANGNNVACFTMRAPFFSFLFFTDSALLLSRSAAETDGGTRQTNQRPNPLQPFTQIASFPRWFHKHTHAHTPARTKLQVLFSKTKQNKTKTRQSHKESERRLRCDRRCLTSYSHRYNRTATTCYEAPPALLRGLGGRGGAGNVKGHMTREGGRGWRTRGCKRPTTLQP